jgi:hypothetical protein
LTKKEKELTKSNCLPGINLFPTDAAVKVGFNGMGTRGLFTVIVALLA